MSERQRLKKDIYKRKKIGLATDDLENQLLSMPYSIKQQLNMKMAKSSELISFLKKDPLNHKYHRELKQLDTDILKLREEIDEDYRLPYSIRKIIDGINYGKGYDIEKKLSELRPKKVEIFENMENARYIKLLLDDHLLLRFNIFSKKEMLTRESCLKNT